MPSFLGFSPRHRHARECRRHSGTGSCADARRGAGIPVVPTRGETLQQLRRMLLFRRLPARRPEALGRTVGRRTLADDGSGAGLEGRHTGKYRRAYEFMVSPRHACRCQSVGSLSSRQNSARVAPTPDMCAARTRTLDSYHDHVILLILATPCARWRRKNTHTKCAK